MITLQHESKDPLIYPGQNCINRIDVPGGATYELISGRHYPIAVVTASGVLVGYNSTSEMRRHCGSTAIKYLAVANLKRAKRTRNEIVIA